MKPLLVEPSGATAARDVLVVADWMSDPAAVVAACARLRPQPASFSFLVPALLHGLDWVGDPYASVSCARRTLGQLEELAERAGLAVERGQVGDPDPIAAILDIVHERPADELVIFVADRHPALGSLAARAYRATGIPTISEAVPRAASVRRRFTVRHMFKGHCPLGAPQAA